MPHVLASRLPKGLFAFVGPLLVLGIWTWASHAGIVDSVLLPPPERVLLAAADVGWRELILHVFASLIRIIVGFQLAAIVGIVGLLMQFSGPVYTVFDGLVETWRPVPPVALVPFFVLIFGFSEWGHLVLVVLGTSLIFVVTTVEALERVPLALIQFGLASGMSNARIFSQILVPAALGNMRAGVRVALALSISLVVVSEFLGASHGLGYLISVSKVTLGTATMLMCTFLLGLIGYGLDLFIRALFASLTSWEIGTMES